MKEWADLIQTVGFPIAMCGACCWYIKSLTEKMMTTIQNNTLALTKLEIKLDYLEGGEKSGSKEQNGIDG